MADTHMTDANAPEETEIEVITAEETTQEFDIGEAPQDDDEDAMEDEDDDGKISAEDADVRDDAEMVFNKHSGPVYSVRVNPVDPRIVITGGGDDVAVIWNREDGNVLYTLAGHQDSVVSVDFSFDGKYAATGGYDGVVKIWDVATGGLVQNLEGPSQEVEWVCWHKKGNVVLAGSGDGTVWMWLATTGECMHVFAGHEDGVTCGSFTGSGKQPLALSGSQDGTARLIQVQTKRVLATLSHDGVDASVAGTVNDTSTATENSVECGGFCNTMNWAATGCLGGYLRIWDLATNQLDAVPSRLPPPCRCDQAPVAPHAPDRVLVHGRGPDLRLGRPDRTTHEDAGWTHRHGARYDLHPRLRSNPVAGLLTASDDESVRLFRVDN
ncbi:hypothetical protein ON010_g11358 [Phytophthora cinnamomi]|nr:hypothetical protein ON010_g11358 [Phytophthora cinnamomi]